MYRKLLLATLALAGLLMTTAAICQQVEHTRTATITAQSMELDWGGSSVDFSGNCKLVVGGPYNATMTAPHMTVNLSAKGDRITNMTASGPVKLTVITRADSKGGQRKITASAQQQATYSEDTQVVKLIGGAEAEMVPTKAPAGTEAVHFTGQSITANLKTRRLTVNNANLTVKQQLH